MSIIKKIFGIRPSERTDVPNGLRGTGVSGGNGIFDEYFNQILFEIQADHIVDTEANVKLTDDPRGTCYYNSTSSEFQDSSDATVTFTAGDKIAWRGLDAITSDIDISTIDDLEHVMFQGVTIALVANDLSLGENQRGEFKYSVTTGIVSIQSGPIQLNNTVSTYEDFSTKDLIINVQSNTTIDVDAKSISFLNVSSIPTKIFDINQTFNMATDRIEGTGTTNELASTWYQIWLDSTGVRKLAPDLVSVTDGTTASKLVDSAADFVTYLVQIGDIVYNLTDLTQTTVTAIDDLNTLSLADDIFVSGENYKIRMLSPPGLGEVKARIGAAYNNSGSNLDDSTYTQIQEEKQYIDGIDFTISGSGYISTVRGIAVVKQVNDWTGRGIWHISFKFEFSSTSATSFTWTFSGVKFKAGPNQALIATPVTTITTFQASVNSGAATFSVIFGANQSTWYLGDGAELESKPTFHN